MGEERGREERDLRLPERCLRLTIEKMNSKWNEGTTKTRRRGERECYRENKSNLTEKGRYSWEEALGWRMDGKPLVLRDKDASRSGQTRN
jgi:hypothetical protein